MQTFLSFDSRKIGNDDRWIANGLGSSWSRPTSGSRFASNATYAEGNFALSLEPAFATPLGVNSNARGRSWQGCQESRLVSSRLRQVTFLPRLDYSSDDGIYLKRRMRGMSGINESPNPEISLKTTRENKKRYWRTPFRFWKRTPKVKSTLRSSRQANVRARGSERMEKRRKRKKEEENQKDRNILKN